MNLFLIIALVVSGLAIYVVLFPVPKKIPLTNKILFSLLALISITLLLIKVVDFSAIDNKETFSQNLNTDLHKARQEPNNILAWNDLGRAFTLEKEYVHAYMAFTQSEQLDSYVGLDIDKQQALSERLIWLMGLAEARILAQGGGVDENANELIQRSLQINDKHPKALWYGGLAAAQRANYSVAQQLWNKLLQQNPPDPLKDVLQNRLNSLDEFLVSENSKQQLESWELSFKLSISQQLLQNQTLKSKFFASLRQGKQSPPIIAKSFDAINYSASNDKLIKLSQLDKIQGMATERSIDWDKPSTLTLIWAKNGNVLDEANVRNEHEITRQNLDSVIEYTLE